ncbi:MAG: histidine phosphatase family protein [Saprospiraceae bacterium]
MKNIFLLAFVLAACFLCGCDSCKVVRVAQGKLYFFDGKTTDIPHWNEEGWTHFFFVRHAEKAVLAPGAPDPPGPPLSGQGMARADRLGEIMKDAGLDAVYTTNFKRTRTTAEKVQAHYSNIPLPINYEFSDAWLANQLIINRGKRIFVVGHSNTVPRMVNKLMGSGSTLPDLDEKNFSAFFVVASRNIGDSEYLWKEY